jgi:hypothetical protein
MFNFKSRARQNKETKRNKKKQKERKKERTKYTPIQHSVEKRKQK